MGYARRGAADHGKNRQTAQAVGRTNGLRNGAGIAVLSNWPVEVLGNIALAAPVASDCSTPASDRSSGPHGPATRLFGPDFLLTRVCRCVSVPAPTATVVGGNRMSQMLKWRERLEGAHKQLQDAMTELITNKNYPEAERRLHCVDQLMLDLIEDMGGTVVRSGLWT